MRKKVLFFAVALVMSVSFAVPAFAADHESDEGYNENVTYAGLYEIVGGIVNEQLGDQGLLNQGQDYVKNIVTAEIMNLLGNSDAVIGFASPILSGTLNSLINSSLAQSGLNLDPVDVSGILNEILGSDAVKKLLSSDLVAEILAKTVEYSVDAVMADALPDLNKAQADKDALVKKYSDYFFESTASNSGEINLIFTKVPYSYTYNMYWNYSVSFKTTSPYVALDVKGWNEALIKTGIVGDMALGGLSDIASFNVNDFTANLPQIIWSSAQKAVSDVISERIEAAKAQIYALIQTEIQNFKDKVKSDLVNELNRIFELKISISESLDNISTQIISHINDSKEYVGANKDKVIGDLKNLKNIVNAADKYTCLDLSKLDSIIDSLIKCLEDKNDKPPVVEPVLVSVAPSASVAKINGNKNDLTITIVGTYSDGSKKTVAEKTFSIDNNAIGTYNVGGYNVYVNTKGNVQIRECYIV